MFSCRIVDYFEGPLSHICLYVYVYEATYRAANLWGLKPGWWWWSPGRLALGRSAAARPARSPRQVGCCCPTGSASSKRSGAPAWGGLLWNWLHRPRRSQPCSRPCRLTPAILPFLKKAVWMSAASGGETFLITAVPLVGMMGMTCKRGKSTKWDARMSMKMQDGLR